MTSSPYRADVVLFLVGSICAFLVTPGSRWTSYLCGRFPDAPFPSILFQIAIVCVSISLVLLVVGCLGMRTLVYLKDSPLKTSLVRVSLSVTSIAALYGCVVLYQPGYVGFTYGFRDWARAEADTMAIRSWLSSITTATVGEVDRNEWPSAVTRLSPGYVWLEENRGTQSVRLLWGGGFGHWGIVVGLEPAHDVPKDVREYILPVEAGVYVWHELQ